MTADGHRVPIDGATADRGPVIADLDRLPGQDRQRIPVGASQGSREAVLDFVMVIRVDGRVRRDEMIDERRAADIMGKQPFQIGRVPGAKQGRRERFAGHFAPQLGGRVVRRSIGPQQDHVAGLGLPQLDVREHGFESGKDGPHRALVHLVGLDPLDEQSAAVEAIAASLIEFTGE